MALLEQREPKKDVNLRTAQLVQLLTEIGPDIPEIARRLGQFKESVRYRYKQKILNRGFAVQASPNYEKLGLKRIITIVDFMNEYKQYAPAILTTMNELCYVVNFYKTLPEGEFVVHASVPTQYIDGYVQFMKLMQSKGMFVVRDVLEFDLFRNPPMRAEYYDFTTGRWDVDWNSAAPSSFSPVADTVGLVDFDKLDLLIIKELQIDANRPLIGIAKRLQVNYKKLAWHYKTHVQGRGLVRGYRINWLGTRYDYKLDKALQRKHRYVILDLLCKNVSEYERMTLMSQSNSLPFLFAEASGHHYYANFGFPVDFINEAMQYLERMISPLRDKAQFHIIDQDVGLAFNISYKLFDEDARKWNFDSDDLAKRFGELVLRIKEQTG